MFFKTPPSPKVLNNLYNQYLQTDQSKSFKDFLKEKGFLDLLNNLHALHSSEEKHLAPDHKMHIDAISIPNRKIKSGKIVIKVLLVDFPDLRRTSLDQEYTPAHYEELLFSKGTHSTGSMYDYYKEISNEKIEIEGSVSDWITLDKDYSFYTNKSSGTSDSYPRNAQKMAEDAVKKAKKRGDTFAKNLDLFGDGKITALFIIHSGLGAETLEIEDEAKNHIWSHKSSIPTKVKLKSNLSASNYLTVPHNCKVGVCAHELGHLVFQWQDFYDANGPADGDHWSGTGSWDLMGSGSWNSFGDIPSHPIALHKAQHDWINLSVISKTAFDVTLAPIKSSAHAIKIVSPKLNPSQYFILENRARIGFDKDIAGEGLLVWKINEHGEQNNTKRPGVLLIQADGRKDLENDIKNSGDSGDPFPGLYEVDHLPRKGILSTQFKDKDAGFEITNITRGVNSKKISFNIVFEDLSQEKSPNVDIILQIDMKGKKTETYRSGIYAGRRAPHRIERFQLKLSQQVENLSIEYNIVSKVNQESGWKKEGEWVGAKGNKIVGFKIRLTGSKAKEYNLKYSARYLLKETGFVNANQWCFAENANRHSLKGMTLIINKKS